MIQRRMLSSLLLALLLLFTTTTLALAEEIVPAPDGVSGFERYTNGLYWWSSAGECGGEFPHTASVRVRTTLLGQTVNLAEDCAILSQQANNAVRDDAYVYFFDADSQLLRKALNAAEADPAQALAAAAPLANQSHDGPLALAEGTLYWPMYNAAVNLSSIRRMPADGSQPATTLTTVNGHVVKLQWYRYAGDNGNVDVLIWITGDGKLFRYVIGQGGPVQLASSILDFNIHTRFGLGNAVTLIYAAQGTVSPSPASPAGKLLQINIATGATTTVYDPTIGNPANKTQVLAVTSDNNSGTFGPARNVYIAVASVTCGDLLCTVGDTSIHRRQIPAGTGGWQLIVASDARSYLRSDDQWLYYIAGDGRAIDRIKTDAPALELDIKADGVELIQTVQSLAQDVALVANKPTFVRGYAHLATNTTGKATWMPGAVLRGFAGNQELAGSPLQPLNNVGLDNTADVDTIRNSSTRSYLFQLPAAWVKNAGSLRVDLVIDPQQVLPETGSRADDTVSRTTTLIKNDDTCLDFVRMHTATTIGANPDKLTEIVARSRALLPVQAFQVRTSNTRISKPVFHVEIECWLLFCVPVPYISDEPFVMADDKDWAMTLLTIWDTFTSDFGSCADSHLTGMVHPSEPSFNGLGLTSFSNDLMVRMEPTGWGAPAFNSPYGGRTLAHELSHNYGRDHIDQTTSPLDCTDDDARPAGPYGAYPYDTCTLGPGYTGFDSITGSLIGSTMAADLMTYNSARWTSKFTWDAVLAEVNGASQSAQAAAIAAPDAAMLMVSGLVTPTQNTARFETFYLFPDGAAPASEVVKSLAAANAVQAAADPYQIRQLDAAGTVLASDPAVVLAGADDVGEAMPFAQYVPFNPNTKRVQLVQGDTVLAEKVMSPQAPSLSLQPPIVDEAKQTLTLAWLAADPDNTLAGGFGDVLYFTVQYSPDDGASWHTLLVQYPWLAATVDTGMLPGSEQARVRVLASDGFNTAIATSAPFVLADHAPLPLIGNLVDGQRVPYGEMIQLLGMVLDAEDGSLAEESLTWTVSGPSPLTGTGSQLGLANLTPGSYTAQLSGTDADGQTGTTSLAFEVLPVVVPDAAEPLLDGLCSDGGYASASLVRIPLADGAAARAWLLHAGEKLYVCFADLHLAGNGNLAMAAGLSLDANNDGGAEVQAGDLGFVVDENGVPYQLVPNGGVLAVTLSPEAGYAAVVERTANGWSAEVAIAQSRLGGWDHAARALVEHGTLSEITAAGAAAGTAWPPAADGAQPATWGALYLGTLPQPGNLAPVAVAGADVYANVAVTKTLGLDGSASFDADGDSLTYAWTQSAGPAVTLSGAATATPTFQAAPLAEATTLHFQLVVNDGTADSAAAEVVVTLAPVARPHTAQTFTPADLIRIFLPTVTQ